MRADALIAQRQLAPSRTAAQSLIEQGRAFCVEAGRHIPIAKVSQKLLADCELFIQPDPADRYVSRGGLKLAGALATTGLTVNGLVCLDAGISTGGFTDCLLQAGAQSVVGVDVGHGQLHPRLHTDSRVRLIEGVNARDITADAIQAPNGGFDLAVADLSFISLTLVLPALAPLIREGGYLLTLVKPQFEVGREGIGRGGIVRDESLYAGVRQKVESAASDSGLTPMQWLDSPITGGDGNREFFMLCRRG
ncbi:TlyA family RNA methyltransferase [Burkholderiaceae bacterium DAT-1]|nr:TlyA family RNA methyltransferase [Burkholderiaceae bacterium DAT-1]